MACAVNSIAPLGVRARFLAEVEKASARTQEPAQLCEVCVLVLPIAGAGIIVQQPGMGAEVLCASNDVVERVEWLQVTLGQGPGLDAIASGGLVVALDLTVSDGRWPTFAAEAVKFGLEAMYAMPLQVGAIQVGVLDLYRDTAAPLNASDFADAVVVTELLTAILLTQTERIDGQLSSWWDQPLVAREIHQATGMVTAQLGVTAREAYVRMQAFAYVQGRLLSDIAHDVVHRRLRFDPDVD